MSRCPEFVCGTHNINTGREVSMDPMELYEHLRRFHPHSRYLRGARIDAGMECPACDAKVRGDLYAHLRDVHQWPHFEGDDSWPGIPGETKNHLRTLPGGWGISYTVSRVWHRGVADLEVEVDVVRGAFPCICTLTILEGGVSYAMEERLEDRSELAKFTLHNKEGGVVLRVTIAPPA